MRRKFEKIESQQQVKGRKGDVFKVSHNVIASRVKQSLFSAGIASSLTLLAMTVIAKLNAIGRKEGALALLFFALFSIIGCNASLPDPESPAAQLYQKRCATCHRLYAPSLLTTDMWHYMLGRMEIEMQRRGVPLPTPAERAMLLEYLQKHAGNSS